jgi:hypothetical protein
MKRLLIAITLACVLSGTALAGDMPGVNQATAPGQVPTVGTTGGVTGVTAPVAGDMPGVNGATTNEPDLGLVTTVLLAIILLGR